VGAEFLASTFRAHRLSSINSRATLNPRRGGHDRVPDDRHGGCDVEVHARPAALRVRSSGAVLCVEDARGELSGGTARAGTRSSLPACASLVRSPR
jgi:hypothetical protein